MLRACAGTSEPHGNNSTWRYLAIQRAPVDGLRIRRQSNSKCSAQDFFEAEDTALIRTLAFLFSRVTPLLASCETVLPRATAEKLANFKPPISLHLDINHWKEPPPDVVRRGMAFAAEYLKDLDDYGRTSSNRLKVVLVGLGNAGKTSIAIRLQGGDPSNKLPIPEERTVGVEIRDIKLGVGHGNEGSRGSLELDVKIWDFAGQRAYYDTHQVGDQCFVPVCVFHGW